MKLITCVCAALVLALAVAVVGAGAAAARNGADDPAGHQPGSPDITSLAPTSGSISGGTTVKISGRDFTGVSAVQFGATSASSFTVDSEIQITAVAPPSPTPGVVDVRVTTAAGTSPVVAADRFTYTSGASSCVVPKLNGVKLTAARKKLKAAGCTLGKVTGHKSKSAQVKKQSARPGKVLPAGSKVNVKVG